MLPLSVSASATKACRAKESPTMCTVRMPAADSCLQLWLAALAGSTLLPRHRQRSCVGEHVRSVLQAAESFTHGSIFRSGEVAAAEQTGSRADCASFFCSAVCASRRCGLGSSGSAAGARPAEGDCIGTQSAARSQTSGSGTRNMAERNSPLGQVVCFRTGQVLRENTPQTHPCPVVRLPPHPVLSLQASRRSFIRRPLLDL
eukprot:scaffold36556_cov62-Phaeocystis_antarctica.AAC.7